MTNSFNRQVGLLGYPVNPGGTFKDLDPAKAELLALVKAAIIAEFGDIWATIGDPVYNSQAVETEIPAEPNKELITSTKINFPALFVWRSGEPRFSWFTTGTRQLEQVWGIEWILGPLEADFAAHVTNLFPRFAALVDQICQLGGHPSYPTTYTGTFLKQTLFDADGCGFSKAEIDSDNGVRWGGASFAEDGSPPIYYGCRVMIRTSEIGVTLDSSVGANPHTGADFKFTGDAEGNDQAEEDDFDAFEEFVEVQSEIE